MNSPRKGLYGMEIPEGYKVRFRDFWRKSYLLDYLFIIFTAGLAFPLWQYVHPTNSWFRMDDPELSFPSRNPVIAESVVLVLIFVPPPVIFVILQIYFRNLHDLHTAILGFIEVIALTALYHAFIWISLGQPRPDFLSICKPVADGVCSDPGRSDLIDARHGFPSGHAAFLFAAALYVTFYCWGKWETFRGSAFFPMQILLWGYVLLAVAVGCTRVADGEHSCTPLLSNQTYLLTCTRQHGALLLV